MLLLAWHLTIWPALVLLRTGRTNMAPSSLPYISCPPTNHLYVTSSGLASVRHLNFTVSPSRMTPGFRSRLTEGANCTRMLIEVDWGTLSAEFWASHVKLVLWWDFFISNLRIERVFLRFPSGRVSVMVSMCCFIGEFQLSSHVIWKYTVNHGHQHITLSFRFQHGHCNGGEIF